MSMRAQTSPVQQGPINTLLLFVIFFNERANNLSPNSSTRSDFQRPEHQRLAWVQFVVLRKFANVLHRGAVGVNGHAYPAWHDLGVRC